MVLKCIADRRREIEESKLLREDLALWVMDSLGPGQFAIGAIVDQWRKLFPSCFAYWRARGALDMEANIRDAICSHQDIFELVDGQYWRVREPGESRAYVQGCTRKPSNVQ